MSEEAIEILLSLGVALAAGFVVGAEREQGEDARFAGIRTFPLYGLAGGIAMLLGPWAIVVIGLSVGALIAVAYFRDTAERNGTKDALGMSTEVAAVVTFALGALCTARELMDTTDRLLTVAAGATATLALLSVKRPLHALMRRVSEQEIYATTKLLALAVIVLPLLPSEAMGPWDAINPRNVGLLVALISGISFAGYVAIRVLGPHRGLGVTGLLGGLASSTAVTLTFSGRARERPALVDACAVAITLASATMFPRVVIELWAVSPALARAALVPFGCAGAAALVFAFLYYRRSARVERAKGAAKADHAELELPNPFSLWSALKFAGLFLVVLLFSAAASHYFAETGLYVSALVTGLADVDAISLSIARLHAQGHTSEQPALYSVALAATANSLAKAGIATVLGGPALGARIAIAMAAALAVGAAVLFLLP
jgi:uncharacterized membrane protein (DUF4010 family)